MATRSTIGISHNGIIKAIFCHWDGYLDNNGKILRDYYKDSVKVNNLIALGDLSSLGKEIGEKHDFDKAPRSECNYYGRDRGEEGTEFKVFQNRSDFINQIGEGYNYLFENNEWLINCGTGWQKLIDAIEMEEAQADD